MPSAFIDMKIKKFLKKVAEEDRESLINEKDIEFLSSIGVDYNKKQVAAQNEPPASYYLTANAFNYKALLISVACFLVVALTLSLILYFSLKPSSIKPPIHYFESNFVKVDSNLEELNSNLDLFKLVVNDNDYDLKIEKTYDSLSGDNLFYSLSFNQRNAQIKLFKLEIVVNSLYEHEQIKYDEPVEAQIAEYTIKYTEDVKSMSGTPFKKVICQGEMQIGEQWIYIENYEETALEQSTFIETLQSIISFN